MKKKLIWIGVILLLAVTALAGYKIKTGGQAVDVETAAVS